MKKYFLYKYIKMDELSVEEQIKLKTLCEFVFCGTLTDHATYENFEKCFQPLFNDNIKIDLYDAYISIVGEKKKYLTYPRLVDAYLRYKHKDKETNLSIFFSQIFNKILKHKDTFVGRHEDYNEKNNDNFRNIVCLSTKKACSKNDNYNQYNESYISKLEVIINRKEIIKGVIIEYDNSNNYELYPKDNNEDILIGLRIKSKQINKAIYITESKRKKLDNQEINKVLYQDSITHIFGTFDENTKAINFLGFKCFSGKTRFIGYPKGESFLFGEFGKKFYNLRLEIDKNKGIILFEPGFIDNESINYFKQELDKCNNNINLNDSNKDILEESELKKLDKNELNLYITTNFEKEDYISDEESDDIKGYDYKEVINLSNRTWIYEEEKKRENNQYLKLDINPIHLKIFQSKSDGMPTNRMKINKDENNEWLSYNPNPFLKHEYTYRGNCFKNPFFDKKKKLENPNKNEYIKNIFHKVLTLHRKKEKKSNEEKNILVDNVLKKSKLKDIFKKISFKNRMIILANDIHEQLIKDMETKKRIVNNNINNFSLIPFYILNEVIPIDINEREKDIKKEEIKSEKKLILDGEEIKNDETIKNNNNNDNDNNNNNIGVIESDAAHFWNIYNSERNVKKWHYFYTLLRMSIARKNNNNNDNDNNNNIGYPPTLLRIRYLFRTMAKIIIIMIKLFKNEKEIKLTEKIEYYRFLSNKENEKIINFLIQNVNNDNQDENIKQENNDEFFDFGNIKNLKDFEAKIKEIKNNEKLIKQKYNYIFNKNIYIENFINLTKEEFKQNQVYRAFFADKRNRIITVFKKESDLADTIILNVVEKNKDLDKNFPFFLGQNKIPIDKDEKFAPEKKSLCPCGDEKEDWIWPLPEKVMSSDIENWDKIKWNKIRGKQIFLNDSEPKLNNIRQGEYIGDCYFLSALGALCDKKEYLVNLIERIEINNVSKGYYVKLNLNGKWKKIFIDKYFPNIIKDNNEKIFCFGCSFKNELWVSIFEKAWAKVNGCYARIACGGRCGDGFDVLTGAISEYHQLLGINQQTKNELWDKLLEAKKNNYVICAGTRSLGFFEIVSIFGKETGLISLHAYTIIDVRQEIYQNNIIKLLKLRNPWGEKEFNGDWSDKSTKWNDDLKKLFGFTEVEDDGIFYMSYEDFTYYFRSFEILKFKDDYETIASCKISKNKANKIQIIEFSIKKKEGAKKDKINVFINLYQKNPRIRKKKKENGKDFPEYFPKPVKAFLILAEKISYKLIQSKTDIKEHFAIEAMLETETTYILFCDVNYRFIYDELYGYNITFYCDKSYEIGLNKLNLNGKESSEMLNNVLYKYYEENPDYFKKTTLRNFDYYRLKEYFKDFPFKILIIKNNGYRNKYFKTYLSIYDIDNKNACIYNDSEASEFDVSITKKVEDYTIVLLMGYTFTDKFIFNYSIENDMVENNIFFKKPIIKNGINLYIDFAEKTRGIILGIKNITEDIEIDFGELYAINPKYNNNDIPCYSIKKGEKKAVFCVRAKPGWKEIILNINFLNSKKKFSHKIGNEYINKGKNQ